MKNLIIKFLNWIQRKFNRINRTKEEILDHIDDYALCDYCGDMFEKQSKKHKFCSQSCYRRKYYEQKGR